MKKAFFIILIGLSLAAQSQPKGAIQRKYEKKVYKAPYTNAISIFTNHSNYGVGIGYDSRPERAGYYVRLSTGKFNEDNYYQIDREYKLSAGFMIGTLLILPDPGWWPMLTFGMSYNRYSFLPGAEEIPGLVVTSPLGLELGMTGQIGRWAPFAATDLIKWQFMFGVGYCF